MESVRKLLIWNLVWGVFACGCSLEAPTKYGVVCGQKAGELGYIVIKGGVARCSVTDCEDCTESEEALCESYRDIDVFDLFLCPNDDYVCGTSLDDKAVCVEPCAPDFMLCGTQCVNFMSDSRHCGKCGNHCNDDETCRGGVCKPNEAKCEFTKCGDKCINLESLHMASCNSCIEGWCNIDAEYSNGCPLDASQDSNHCGVCGNKCTDGKQCVNGECTYVCPNNQTLCYEKCITLDTFNLIDCETCKDGYSNKNDNWLDGCESKD